MAPLSKELSGLILPYDKYGSHLDEQGRTVDADLERRNFEAAGLTLSEIWSDVVIDGHPTVAEYIDPAKSEMDPSTLLKKDQEWINRHVRTSQYFTQIVKCLDTSCCSAPRSSYFSILPQRFLPPPFPVVQTGEGLKTPDRSGSINQQEQHLFPSLFTALSLSLEAVLPRSVRSLKELPYDLYCPSVQSVLTERTCKICGKYFASKVMLKSHLVLHKEVQVAKPKPTRPVRLAAKRQRELMAIIVNDEYGPEDADWIQEEELDIDGLAIPEDDPPHVSGIPVCSIRDHLSNPWVEDQ